MGRHSPTRSVSAVGWGKCEELSGRITVSMWRHASFQDLVIVKVSLYTYRYIYMHANVYVPEFDIVYRYPNIPNMYVCMFVCKHIFMYIDIDVRIYTYVLYIDIHIHVYHVYST